MDSNFVHLKGTRLCSTSIAILCVYMSINLNAQAVIYKRDGSQVEVERVDNMGKVRTYNLLGDPEGVVRIISSNAIDSIRYADGTLERLSSYELLEEERRTDMRKNFVGINVWPLLSSKLNVFYERLIIGDKLGFKNYLFVNKSSYSYYYGHRYLNQSSLFYINSGLHYYFLQSDMFRFGTGISFLIGQFEEVSWIEIRRTTQTGMMIHTSFWYLFNERLYSSLSVDFPLGWVPVLKAEITLNF